MDYSNYKKYLDHLSEDEKEELITRYYNNENIKSLIIEYKIPLTNNYLVKCFPVVVSKKSCNYCGGRLIQEYQGKEYKKRYRILSTGICEKCKHNNVEIKREDSFIYENGCNCIRCKEEKQKILNEIKEEKKREQIEELNREKHIIRDYIFLSNCDEKQIYEDLSFSDKMFLGALIRHSLNEGYKTIDPISWFNDPFMPDKKSISYLKILFDKNLINIDPDLNFDAIYLDEFTGEINIKEDLIHYKLNITSLTKNYEDLINDILYFNYELNVDEAFDFWKFISLAECLEFLSVRVFDLFSTNLEIGNKTVEVFNKGLENFSSSQMNYFTWISCRSALDYGVTKRLSNLHMKNAAISSIQYHYEKAKINEREIFKPFRNKSCPQSTLSKYFFDTVLKIGEKGFYEKPSKELIFDNLNINN